MKKAIILLAMVLLLGNFNLSYAEDNAHSICKSISSIATTFMEVRQRGDSLSESVDKIKNSNMDSKGKKLSTAILMNAYEKPNYSSEKYKKRAINEFANDWYKACMEKYSE